VFALTLLTARWNRLALGGVEAGVMRRAAPIAVLAACLLSGACTSTSSSSASPGSSSRSSASTPEPATPVAPNVIDPCSLLPGGLVGRTLPGSVTKVRELSADEFASPPPAGTAVCAYETNGRSGELLVGIRPMGRKQYDALFVERDRANTRRVRNVGEDARYSGCGGLSVYANGRVLQVGIQFADCNALGRLVTLARVALRRL